MAKPSVYSILAVLLIAVHSTRAFPSDIHYTMTKAEKLAIFDSEDPDPEYDVFPMSIPGMRHIRGTNEAIKCTIDINGEEINLNLKPAAQHLASKYIPVWSAQSNQHSYKDINYQPLPTAMSGVGEFIMYQDLENAASLVVYTDPVEKIVVEGFITSRYAIKSLPKRLIGELLNEIDDVTEIPNMMGGPIESNKDTGFYAVITNPETSEPDALDPSLDIDESAESTEGESHDDTEKHGGQTTPASVSSTPEHHEATEPKEPLINHDSEKHGGQTTPEVVSSTPEHHEATESKEPLINHDSEKHGGQTTPASVSSTPEHHEATEPKEPLINHDSEKHGGQTTPAVVSSTPEHHEATEPIDPTRDSDLTPVDDNPVNNQRKKRYAQKTLYPEILVVLDHNALSHRTMTQALRLTLAFWNAVDLIYKTLSEPKVHLNIAGIIIAKDNTATPYIAKDTSVPGIGDLDGVSSKVGRYFYAERIRFPVKQYDMIIAMTTMNLCEGKIDSCESTESKHGYFNGLPVCPGPNLTKTKTLNSMIVHNNGIFGPEISFFIQYEPGYSRSSCIHDDCTGKVHPVFLLASKETECLRNKPRSIRPVDEVLPGRWLSMDGQCLNEGYAQSCTYKRKIGKCVTKGCRDKHTMKCVRSEEVPLPGTTCGTAKTCNKQRKCVYRL